MTVLLVFGTVPQMMTNTILAQEDRGGETCFTQQYAGDMLTQCSVGGSGTGGSGGHNEFTICDTSGNCVGGTFSGGHATGGGGGQVSSSYQCSKLGGCFIEEGNQGGSGVGGGSFDRPQQGFSSGGVAPQQGFSSGGGVAPQQGVPSGGNPLP